MKSWNWLRLATATAAAAAAVGAVLLPPAALPLGTLAAFLAGVATRTPGHEPRDK